MSMDFYVPSDTMVRVANGTWLADPSTQRAKAHDLGLASEEIRITINLKHKDVNTDALGTEVPAEVVWMAADAHITMTLCFYEREILRRCVMESMGGGGGIWGRIAPTGRPLGGGKPLYVSGNHYIALSLVPGPDNLDPGAPFPTKDPWFFPAAYLLGPPLEFPLGNGYSLVQLRWRAIPFPISLPYSGAAGEFVPSGQISLGVSGQNFNQAGIFPTPLGVNFPINIGGVPVYLVSGMEIVSSGLMLWEHNFALLGDF